MIQKEVPMKRFTSIHEVSVEDALSVLQLWEEGQLPYDEVQGWAETVFLSGWQEFERDDSRSVLAAVIEMLEDMYVEPVIKKDIPTLRMILLTAQDTPAKAWEQLDRFRAETDWSNRFQQAVANLQQYGDVLLDTIDA
jgi:hypothetical protein